MSVIVIIRFPVSDVPKAIEGLQENSEVLAGISKSVTGSGLIHHRFVSGDAELGVIDEWETEEQFRTFFDSNPQVADIMGSIGMSGPPEISVYQSVDVAGTI
jgi:hypothetical protein